MGKKYPCSGISDLGECKVNVKPLIIGDLKAKFPLIQGGMGVGISLSGLAGAVAKAGGIGIISTAQIGYREPDFDKNPIEVNLRTIGKEIRLAREKAEGGIVGVNIMVATKRYEDYVKAAVEAGIDLVVSGAGLPIKLPELIGESKTKIAPIVSSVKSANVILRMWDKKYKKTADLVVIEGSAAKVVAVPTTLDQVVTITATLTSNPTVTSSTSITVKAPVVEGQVGELTSELIQKLGNPSITVSGVLTDYYEDFKNAGNNTIQSYDMTVMMEEGAWFGSWNIEGNPNAALQDVYRMGEETGVEDQFGNVGHAFLKSFINKDNEVENKKQIDYLSIPVVWEAQHLWNHLGNLNISKFVYDAENKVYFYDHQKYYLKSFRQFFLTW